MKIYRLVYRSGWLSNIELIVMAENEASARQIAAKQYSTPGKDDLEDLFPKVTPEMAWLSNEHSSCVDITPSEASLISINEVDRNT